MMKVMKKHSPLKEKYTLLYILLEHIIKLMKIKYFNINI